jgi:hypothetical protein
VGEWTKGSSYESNRGGGYCSQAGRVCHEVRPCTFSPGDRVLMSKDDLYPTFGTGQSDASLVIHRLVLLMKGS